MKDEGIKVLSSGIFVGNCDETIDGAEVGYSLFVIKSSDGRRLGFALGLFVNADDGS